MAASKHGQHVVFRGQFPKEQCVTLKCNKNVREFLEIPVTLSADE
jgi:hypothetical protein